MTKSLIRILVLFGLISASVAIHPNPNFEEYDNQFWIAKGQQELQNRLTAQNLNLNKAKNIIMFLGDGMSITTLTAARILKGQQNGHTGEEEYLSFEKFPYSGLSKTYCVDAQVADSACSATAYLCGVKTNLGTIGVNANVKKEKCDRNLETKNRVSSLAAWAQESGMSAGIVTNTALTDASPAGTYAHTASRSWQSKAEGDCIDIATQLITEKPGRDFEVILGGGSKRFEGHQRPDRKDLIKEWRQLHPHGKVVQSLKQLQALNTNNVTHIFGLFADSHLNYHAEKKHTEPTLTEMTEVAIRQLSKNKNGYFLFIEGGLIDKAHHSSKALISLDETLELEKAVQRARDLTDPEETLIVVTADHAHGLTLSGYPDRGNSILGLSGKTDHEGVSYATLNYAAGNKQYIDSDGNRLDLLDEEDKMKTNPDFKYPSYINVSNGLHSGEDVGIYASGPYEHLFSGVMEQSSIPHLIAYAACIGDGAKMCDDNYRR